ncbi:outer membrane protein assembly factor BamB [Allohahella marinimesophila]|uniref:Outer membrane protein assembly factor BamB n=1 Tax=Allohahella marinimesophila TaxID=1054972 RepID=A0ABP7P4K9_9GAMM
MAWPGRQSGVLLVILLAGLIVSGCGDEDVRPEPVELKPVTPQVSLSQVWSVGIGDGYDDEAVSLAPLVLDDQITAVSRDGELQAIERSSGEILWERSIDEAISGGVGGDSSRVFVTTADGNLIAVSATDGTELWQISTGSEVLSAPLVARGLVFVQTIDGLVSAYDVANGQKRWDYREQEPALTVRGTSPLNYDDRVELLLAAFANGSVVALDPRSGIPAWSQIVAEPRGKTELDRLIDIDGGTEVADGNVYAVAYQGNVAQLSAIRGRVDWLEKASSFARPTLGDRLLVLTAENGDVVAWDASSKTERWRTSEYAYRELSTPVMFRDHVFFGDLEGYVHVLELAEGRTVARFRPADDAIIAAPIASADAIYFYGSDGELSAWTFDE